MSAESFHTDDVDEANEMARQVFYESHVEPVRNAPSPFRFEMKFDTVGPVTVGILSHGCEILAMAGGLDMTYSVGVPLKGAFPMRFGTEEVVADPTTAVVTTPTSQVTYRGYRTGTERLVVLSFDRDQLTSHLASLIGRESVGPIKLAPSLDLRQGVGAQWWRLTSTLALSLQSPASLPSHPMVSTHLSNAVMTSLLLAADHPYREALESWTRPVPPAIVRRAMDIIEQHAHKPLTVVDVAKAVGCSLRALQIGFRKHVDMTPADYIKRVRLDRAHAMLSFADPTASTVAGIAQIWGFNQPGRFAAEYRKVYGVSPSVTLRSGWTPSPHDLSAE